MSYACCGQELISGKDQCSFADCLHNPTDKYAERSASVLLQLNNSMQASMGKSQLSHLGLLQIHYDTFVDLVNIVGCYVQLHQLHCYQPAFINLPLIYGLSTGNKNSPIPISVYRTVTQHQWPGTCGRCWSTLHMGRRWLPRLLGDDKSRQLFHAKLVFPIHVIQKQLKSGEPLLHQMFHMVSINLQTEISRFSTPGTELITVLNMLTATEASAVKSDLHAFPHAISM